MKKISETIIFFGSGPVAARSLELLATVFPIEAVVTKPKPAGHKGNFPVLDVADRLKLPVRLVTNKKGLDELIATQPFRSRVGILVDFGIIVSQTVINYFPLGIVNSHFSLLPEWRGADPITFSVLSGQKQTGISLMLLVEKMDEGPLLAQAPYDLSPDITTPQLTNDLIELSFATLKEVLPLYLEGKIHPAPQEQATISNNPKPTYSRKLTKEDGIIDWTKFAKQIEHEVRAFLGWPGSRTILAGKEVIITKARVSSELFSSDSYNVGQGFITLSGELAIKTGKGVLIIETLKPAGKKEMTAKEFIAGHKDRL
jgi:methionyl-tRNA formyltransferase